MSGAQIDPAVLSVMQKSCMDCHSEQTTWPWYSYVAPMSMLVESDVSEGRGHFDMSRWDEYDQDRREEILGEIASMVRNKKMPLPQYTLMHSDAKLNAAGTDLIYQWAHAERKRMKEQARQK